jgi:hypothetical protein
MPKLSNVTFTGASGKAYNFEVYPIGTVFNDVGGVYAITKRYRNNQGGYSHDVIYLGETEDLSTRFNNHHKADCFDQREANCICTHRDDNANSRLTKEADLIKRYTPPCND